MEIFEWVNWLNDYGWLYLLVGTLNGLGIAQLYSEFKNKQEYPFVSKCHKKGCTFQVRASSMDVVLKLAEDHDKRHERGDIRG